MRTRPAAFDLDMTLIDSRPQVLAAYRSLAEQTGVAGRQADPDGFCAPRRF